MNQGLRKVRSVVSDATEYDRFFGVLTAVLQMNKTNTCIPTLYLRAKSRENAARC